MVKTGKKMNGGQKYINHAQIVNPYTHKGTNWISNGTGKWTKKKSNSNEALSMLKNINSNKKRRTRRHISRVNTKNPGNNIFNKNEIKREIINSPRNIENRGETPKNNAKNDIIVPETNFNQLVPTMNMENINDIVYNSDEPTQIQSKRKARHVKRLPRANNNNNVFTNPNQKKYGIMKIEVMVQVFLHQL